MIVVGMVSCYREGRLVRMAIESLLAVELDRLYVYEGPAGEPIDADVPESHLDWLIPKDLGPTPNVLIHEGRWRTDARKRNQMLNKAKGDFPGVPFWCVVVDGDEVLVNGKYLRDRLNWIEWTNEQRGASIMDEGNPPIIRWPLRLMEHDGSLSLITARVFRGDMVQSIDHSSSVITNVGGVREGWGNYEENSRRWIDSWFKAVDEGHMAAWPPFSCEPHLVHRSNLRHPARAGLRMSEQEAVEFAKAQADET